MAKTKISEWSATPASNTDIDGINIAEGCAPSGINDAIREMMAQVKDLYSGTTGDAIAIAGGGTGATTASAARTALGVAIGTDVLPVANPSYTGTLTGGTGVVNFGAGQFYKAASGNVGMGTSSPSTGARISFGNSSAGGQSLWAAYFATNSDTAPAAPNFGLSVGWNRSGGGGESNLVYGIGLGSAAGLAFSSSNGTTVTERARIDASGNFIVGATGRISNERLSAQSSGNAEAAVFSSNGTYATTLITNVYPSGVRNLIQFRISTTDVGNITSAGSTTSYNTTSDYRLKKAVQPMQNALTRVAALKPVTYKWKSDGSAGEGFIAHELQAVVPECVTGEKDAVDAEGNPVYQGIDASFLVGTLTAAIQEQQAIITALTARVEALEAV